jgi:hypothetical protein
MTVVMTLRRVERINLVSKASVMGLIDSVDADAKYWATGPPGGRFGSQSRPAKRLCSHAPIPARSGTLSHLSHLFDLFNPVIDIPKACQVSQLPAPHSEAVTHRCDPMRSFTTCPGLLVK